MWIGETISLLGLWLNRLRKLYAPDLSFKLGSHQFHSGSEIPYLLFSGIGIQRGQERGLADGLALPVQRSFFECINVSDRKNPGEASHACQRGRAVVRGEIPELHGPWIHEDDFDIEDDEQH